MSNLTYIEHGGFTFIHVDEFTSKYSLNDCLRRSVSDWKYILLLGRIITYPYVFKNIIDKQGYGLYVSRIWFKERLHTPDTIISYLSTHRTIYILNSQPQPRILLKRIILNPRFSDTLIFSAKISDSIDEDLSEYSELINIARKLYVELLSITFKHGIGRFNVMEISEKNGEMEINICIPRKGYYLETKFENSKLVIKDIESCFS